MEVQYNTLGKSEWDETKILKIEKISISRVFECHRSRGRNTWSKHVKKLSNTPNARRKRARKAAMAPEQLGEMKREKAEKERAARSAANLAAMTPKQLWEFKDSKAKDEKTWRVAKYSRMTPEQLEEFKRKDAKRSQNRRDSKKESMDPE